MVEVFPFKAQRDPHLLQTLQYYHDFGFAGVGFQRVLELVLLVGLIRRRLDIVSQLIIEVAVTLELGLIAGNSLALLLPILNTERQRINISLEVLHPYLFFLCVTLLHGRRHHRLLTFQRRIVVVPEERPIPLLLLDFVGTFPLTQIEVIPQQLVNFFVIVVVLIGFAITPVK
jgi:hypothetical protein